MANETKTEAIVRDHFRKFEDVLNIAEKISDNPKIDKLLKNASKSGGGKGFPEFIITYKNNPDFLIVIECKPNVSKHESPNRDKYSEYAVDGALLYASYLSKEFDVLAIGVSGESKSSIRISHFLHLKGSKTAESVFGGSFLDAESYLRGYVQNPQKFRQDHNELLEFASKLNDNLQSHKILANGRSLLISSILIALANDAFRSSYAKHKAPQNLARSLVETTRNELEKANITGNKLTSLRTQFDFIRTDTTLSEKDNFLEEAINSIDANINSFIKTHEYFDALGALYIEFLKYSNSDKGLGIVLTPPHITELFADLARVNKDSIVYDNCAGTAGFLISAMKKMIGDAKGDEQKVNKIKSEQLVGVEYQTHIFALTISNMYIHGDGKTSILKGDCFDQEIVDSIKQKKPNVGLLNPPYKSQKDDIEELEFVLNNLECLQQNGICVAILPMQCALTTSTKIEPLKQKIMEQHTLEAVLSMPNELFNNSKTNVVSCVMVFRAHVPHPENKEVFFGYFKNDGFMKVKNKGRIDQKNKWESIKSSWLDAYINPKNIAGLSVMKKVKATDEWCAEAYMETNYSKITRDDFERVVKNYAMFKFFTDEQRND